MIDDKKIEEAASIYSTNNDYSVIGPDDRMLLKPELENTFEAGVHWAINEFIKDLWHPSNEVPEIGRVIIMENYYPDGRIEFPSNWRKSTSHNPIEGNTQKWLYVDDLLPKKGGEQ